MPNEVIETKFLRPVDGAWATFFREMNWGWEYRPEEEEAVLPCGTVYLPTFKVRTGNGVYFFEVRAEEADSTYEVDEYVRVTGDHIILVTGYPSGTDFNWVDVNTWRSIAYSHEPAHDMCMWSQHTRRIDEVYPDDNRTVVQVAGIPFMEAAFAWIGELA